MCTCSAKLPFGKPVHPDGVVEVARRFAVDGDDVHAAEVAPALAVPRAAITSGMACGLLHHLRREAVRQVVLADDDLDVDAEIVRVAQDLDHAAHGALAALGELEQLDVDDHAVQVRRAVDLRRGSTPMRSICGAGGGISMPSGISIHCWMRVVVRDDEAAAAARCGTRPPRWGARAAARARSRRRRGRPASMRPMRTTTRSPCMALSAGLGGNEDVALPRPRPGGPEMRKP